MTLNTENAAEDPADDSTDIGYHWFMSAFNETWLVIAASLLVLDELPSWLISSAPSPCSCPDQTVEGLLQRAPVGSSGLLALEILRRQGFACMENPLSLPSRERSRVLAVSIIKNLLCLVKSQEVLQPPVIDRTFGNLEIIYETLWNYGKIPSFSHPGKTVWQCVASFFGILEKMYLTVSVGWTVSTCDTFCKN